MAWRLSPVTAPSWARTTCTHEALGTDQMRMVASGEAENTKSCERGGGRGDSGRQQNLHPRELPAGQNQHRAALGGDPRRTPLHLRRVEDDTGDLLGVALERGQDLLRALVEDDDVFISPACKPQRRVVREGSPQVPQPPL